MGVIFILSHTPGNALPHAVNGVDKLVHILMYTTLGIAALWAVRRRFRQSAQVTTLLVILFCVLYGISDEFHQYFIPGRTPSFFDLLADFTGGVLAVTLWSLWSKQHQALPQN